MNKLAHLVVGATLGLGVTHVLGYGLLGSVLGTTMAGMTATLPDSDHCWGLPARGMFEKACRPLKSPFEHRGMLHAPLFGMLVGYLIAAGTGVPGLGLMVAIGWLSHILTDAPSLMGVPMLFPFSWKRYRLGSVPVHSGNRGELPLAVGLLGLVVVLMVMGH